MKSTIILASNNEKSFSKEIIEDLQEENKLCSQYTKLLASAKIEYKGETHNLSSLMKYMMDKDIETRIGSTKLYYSYFEENKDKLSNTKIISIGKITTKTILDNGLEVYKESEKASIESMIEAMSE